MDMPEGVQQAYDKIDFKPDFNIHIRPLLSDRCFLCHGTDLKSRKASLDLSDRAAAIGASIKSGGNGKKELSAKETAASARSAFGPRAKAIRRCAMVGLPGGRIASGCAWAGRSAPVDSMSLT